MLKIFGDRIIWGVAILLFICSILLVYSSGGYQSLTNHITHLVMGIGLIYILSRFNKWGDGDEESTCLLFFRKNL